MEEYNPQLQVSDMEDTVFQVDYVDGGSTFVTRYEHQSSDVLESLSSRDFNLKKLEGSLEHEVGDQCLVELCSLLGAYSSWWTVCEYGEHLEP